MNTYIKALRPLIVILALSMGFYSCEDVITLDLESSAQRHVIEAKIDLGDSSCLVKISKTADFYDANEFDKVEDASINLNLSNGNSYSLTEIENGVYQVENISINPADSAFLSISLTSGELYNAATQCPRPVTLDSLEFDAANSPLGSETVYRMRMNFTDPQGVGEYYSLKVWRNGALDAGYTLVDDEERDGETVSAPYLGGFPFDEQDSIIVQLISTDQAYYDYYLQVDEVQDQGFNAAAPYNPVGNFGSEVLGCFVITSTSELQAVAGQ